MNAPGLEPLRRVRHPPRGRGGRGRAEQQKAAGLGDIREAARCAGPRARGASVFVFSVRTFQVAAPRRRSLINVKFTRAAAVGRADAPCFGLYSCSCGAVRRGEGDGFPAFVDRRPQWGGAARCPWPGRQVPHGHQSDSVSTASRSRAVLDVAQLCPGRPRSIRVDPLGGGFN